MTTSKLLTPSGLLLFALGFVLSVTAITTRISGSIQSTQPGVHIPVGEATKIRVSGATQILIKRWNQPEIFETDGTIEDKVARGRVQFQTGGGIVSFTCSPSTPIDLISLTLTVPEDAVLSLQSIFGQIEVGEREGPINIFFSKEVIGLDVPKETSIDLQRVKNAKEYTQTGPDKMSVVQVAGRQIGTGETGIIVGRTEAVVTVVRRLVNDAGKVRPLTEAARAIARHNNSMGTALRRGEPPTLKGDAPVANISNKSDRGEEGDVELRAQLVDLNIQVTDRDGKVITGLKSEDFSVYEDGVLQPISSFAPARTPFNLVLLLDMSGSVRGKLGLIKEAALHFVDLIGPEDSVAVITFNTDVNVISHLTKNRKDVRDSILKMDQLPGNTAFYDAVGYSVAEELSGVKGQRNAVVVLSDGEDNSIAGTIPRPSVAGFPVPTSPTLDPNYLGSFLTYKQVVDGITEADVLIYPIHLSDDYDSESDPAKDPLVNRSAAWSMHEKIAEVSRKQMPELAELSGGRFFNAAKVEDLKGVYENIAADLRTIYSVSYSPTNRNSDGKFRRIRIVIKSSITPNAIARTRPGYFAR